MRYYVGFKLSIFILLLCLALQVFIKLMRRYKYLEKMFEEEMKKVLVFIKGFTPSERIKLARMTALWIGKLSRIMQLMNFKNAS